MPPGLPLSREGARVLELEPELVHQHPSILHLCLKCLDPPLASPAALFSCLGRASWAVHALSAAGVPDVSAASSACTRSSLATVFVWLILRLLRAWLTSAVSSRAWATSDAEACLSSDTRSSHCPLSAIRASAAALAACFASSVISFRPSSACSHTHTRDRIAFVSQIAGRVGVCLYCRVCATRSSSSARRSEFKRCSRC